MASGIVDHIDIDPTFVLPAGARLLNHYGEEVEIVESYGCKGVSEDDGSNSIRPGYLVRMPYVYECHRKYFIGAGYLRNLAGEQTHIRLIWPPRPEPAESKPEVKRRRGRPQSLKTRLLKALAGADDTMLQLVERALAQQKAAAE